MKLTRTNDKVLLSRKYSNLSWYYYLKVKHSITVNVFGNIDLFCQKVAKELTTSNSLVNDSESKDVPVIIMTPVMLDEDLNQKIQSLNNKQSQRFDMMAFINGLDS